MRHSTACHLLEAEVDKKLKEWNETWFGDNQKIDVKKATDNIPDFLKKR